MDPIQSKIKNGIVCVRNQNEMDVNVFALLIVCVVQRAMHRVRDVGCRAPAIEIYTVQQRRARATSPGGLLISSSFIFMLL